MDPNVYRYYDCNLKCPKFSARVVRCNELILDRYLKDYEGYGQGTTVVVTPNGVPLLKEATISGRLSVFIKTATSGGYSQYYIRRVNSVLQVTPIVEVYVGQSVSVVGSMIVISLPEGEVVWNFNGF